MRLLEYRKRCGLTQQEASVLLGVSPKTYFRYETDDKYVGSLKYQKMCEILEEKCKIDDEHGLLTVDFIKEHVAKVLQKYNINYCYLFGSYAKGKATESSDVDLLIDSDINGLKYYGLLQDLIDNLHKKVDLIKYDSAVSNPEFLNEILKDGIRIYG